MDQPTGAAVQACARLAGLLFLITFVAGGFGAWRRAACCWASGC